MRLISGTNGFKYCDKDTGGGGCRGAMARVAEEKRPEPCRGCDNLKRALNNADMSGGRGFTPEVGIAPTSGAGITAVPGDQASSRDNAAALLKS